MGIANNRVFKLLSRQDASWLGEQVHCTYILTNLTKCAHDTIKVPHYVEAQSSQGQDFQKLEMIFMSKFTM